MTTSANRTHLLASLVLGCTVAVTACAPEDATEDETIGETSQGLTGVWEWNDVEGTKCGNGSQTGFGIRPGTTSDVVIYLEGGGVCFDDVTCATGIASWFKEGFDGARFLAGPPSSGIFDKTAANNPYKNSTIVYIPYCTGDYHSGDTVRGANGTLNFNGRINLERDLAIVKARIPNPSRVTLSGASAGGFGSLFNYGRVAEIYANTRVDLVSDSGPALWNNAPVFAGAATWNTAAALPAGCTTCAGSYRDLYAYYAKKYPNSRFAYVGWDEDPTMSLGYVLLPFLYREELRKLVFNTFAPLPNLKHFVAEGKAHTMVYVPGTAAQNKRCNWFFGLCFPTAYGPTMTLSDWLTKMYTDDPTWAKQSALIE